MPATARKYNSPLRTRLARETRQAIASAGRRLFAERGFAATSVETISDWAGVTRGAFYRHFRDKDALFEVVLRQIADELVEHVWQRSYELARNGPERERFAARLFVERVSAPETHRILALDGPAVLGHEGWTRILSESIFAPLASALAGWAEKGFVPPALVEPLTHLLAGLFTVAATRVAAASDGERAARDYEDALVFIVRSLRGERRSADVS